MGALYHKCNTQSSAPEDGRDHRPKHVELIGIINKPLLLHLVGCLYYVDKLVPRSQVLQSVPLMKTITFMYVRHHVKGLLVNPILTKNRKKSKNLTNRIFIATIAVEATLFVVDGRTDGQTEGYDEASNCA